MEKIELINRIEAMVIPLHPPIFAFEQSIRRTPFMILIGVLLSARTKDTVTKKAVESLFAVADTPEKMASLSLPELEKRIYPVGFYKQKAKHIQKLCQLLIDSGTHSIPNTMETLTALPGVGRKTANLVLALAFNQPSVAVDVHVARISQRLGWVTSKKNQEIESQLRSIFPQDQWNRINQILVAFGQTLCKPKSPQCSLCTISNYCPSAFIH